MYLTAIYRNPHILKNGVTDPEPRHNPRAFQCLQSHYNVLMQDGRRNVVRLDRINAVQIHPVIRYNKHRL